jgi:hypothetical protein
MKTRILFACLAFILLLQGTVGSAAESPADRVLKPLSKTELDKLAGQPVDLAPWAYTWRADLSVQEKPEAYFIPRRLERIDKVYRTAATALTPEQLKSSNYGNQPDMLKPFPPQPKGRLQAGLLWTGRLHDFKVELHWPADLKEIPAADAVDVRVYPTAWGWFGWTVDAILSNPEISSDGHTWTYQSDRTAKMDHSYNNQVDAATEMVAVFYGEKDSPKNASSVPSIRIMGPNLGTWKRVDVEIEWGFQQGTEKSEFDGALELSTAISGPVAPLEKENGVTVTDGNHWKSLAESGDARRGIVVPLLYAPDVVTGLDSRVTVWVKNRGFTFRINDLARGPIYLPEQGVFVTKAGSGQTARQFTRELAAQKLKGIRQMTREHQEAASWEEVMKEVRLWTCPEGTVLAPFPQVEDPAMQVEVPDAGWTAAWRAGTVQLKGKHMWGGLAFEVGRVAHEMDMIGLHQEADKVYEHFLKSPGVKSDGDYSDGAGALEWASAMRHDMGYSHDGTHASTGRLLFAMAERYFLTGDKEWFRQNRERLQAAADWIIRQRTTYMKDIPNRKDLHVAGLMPPQMLGDYALPACDWHWYYVDNALSLQAIQRFADALMDFDAEAGRKYRSEAEAFRNDLRRTAEREAALAPVRLGRDGAYHSFIPLAAYSKGLPTCELGAPQFPDCERFIGAMPIAEPYAAMDAGDHCIMDTLDIMEELGTSADAVRELENARQKKGLPTGDAWFWNCYVRLPKASHNANIYLMQDDVPNFLRYWMNCYAAMIGADGRMWEAWQLGNFDPCSAPDNGTAGWFMENFRDLLVMEEGQSLWIARATPRAWLEQGKKISVKNAPTYFGALAYTIDSDVDNGKISATVDMPSRKSPDAVLLRFRHPKQTPIKSVMVNGKAWNDFDPAKEIIRLHGVEGSVRIEAFCQ